MDQIYNPVLTHALYLLEEKSWSVIPIGDNKKPLVEWKQFQTVKATREEVVGWFEKYPDANLGVVTGKISSLSVIDIDPRHGGDLNLLANIQTVKSKTGGGGEHEFFQYEVGVENRAGILEGVDIRGEGGYVVVPPSRHASGNYYEWILSPNDTAIAPLPGFIRELIFNSQTKQGKSFGDGAINGVPEGRRNESAASVAGQLLNKYPPDKWESVVWPLLRGWNTQNQPQLDEGELYQVFQSISKREYGQRQDEWPEPIEESAYYGLAGDIVKAIEPHTEADPVALLVNLLVGFGSIIGDTSFVQVEADKHTGRLFALLVGDSSKARKGVSWNQIKRLLGAGDPAWEAAIQTGLSSGEGLIWAVRDEITKKEPRREQKRIVGYDDVIVDEGIKDKRLLIVEPEFASTLRILGREGNTLSPIIRNAWDSGKLQSLTKNSPAKAIGAHISIIGHITKGELLRYLTETEMGNGFGNRFLFICVRRSKSLPMGGDIQSVNFQPLVVRLQEAIKFAREPKEITWGDEARNIWIKTYPELSEGQPGLIGALTARSEAIVLRLSCIYALLDLSSAIMPPHLKAALAIWQYAKDSVRHIFRSRTGNTLADDIFKLLEESPSGLTRTEIINRFGRHISSENLSNSLSILASAGKAQKVTRLSDGRSAEVWSAISQEVREKRIKRVNSQSDDGQTNSSSLNSHNSQPIPNQSPSQTSPPEPEMTSEQLSIEQIKEIFHA